MILMQDRIDARPERQRISVVIPHLNQPEFLARCLASLAAGTRPPDEVIVVDNGSHELPETERGAPTAGSSCRSGGQIYHRCSYCQNTA